ncbi:MAG: aldo/keto reductase [Gemmatimonadota bacterium]|nr:aldo/keto reductase [Gemmatimonadota bacterium]
MKYRTLGRTGLRVSVLGIGTGGPSQFGQNSGVSETDVSRMVRRALALGVNFFDTAAGYGESEAILGRALTGVPREDYVLATKVQVARDDWTATPEDVVVTVERSLERLRVDVIDIMQFHGVKPEDYARTIEIFLPVMARLQEQGKFRFLGVSETYSLDFRHEMFPMALADDHFDTAMVGYNMISPTAERSVLPMCREKNVGVICMVAVRRALSRPDVLAERIAYAKEKGLIERESLPDVDPLGWLVKGHVTSLPSAAYKYVASHPAMGTVLTGTANIDHLEANVKAILGPPLPDEDVARLRDIFGAVWEPLGN